MKDGIKFTNEDDSDIEITEVQEEGDNTIYFLKGINSDTIQVSYPKEK